MDRCILNIYTNEIDSETEDLLHSISDNFYQIKIIPSNEANEENEKKSLENTRRDILEIYGTKQNIKETECEICYDNIDTLSNVLDIPCKHVYHVECISKWAKQYNNSCPKCRIEL